MYALLFDLAGYPAFDGRRFEVGPDPRPVFVRAGRVFLRGPTVKKGVGTYREVLFHSCADTPTSGIRVL